MLRLSDGMFEAGEIAAVRAVFKESKAGIDEAVALDKMLKAVSTALILVEDANLGKVAVMSKIIYEAVESGFCTYEEVQAKFPQQVTVIVDGLIKAHELYRKHKFVETENFRKLLLVLARDIRVIIIMICDRLYLMRNLHLFDAEEQQKIAQEASYLYAPLAHRLGLYKIKSELEDLSMKCVSRDIYKEIASKLNETKRSRDKYISEFIGPLK